MITAANFHLSTKAEWTMIDNGNVDLVWSALVEANGLFFRSESGSEYVVCDGVVFRKADHWGSVASCDWKIAACASNMPGQSWTSQHMVVESGHGLPISVMTVACCALDKFEQRSIAGFGNAHKSTIRRYRKAA